jgi:hypothetical protein
MIDLIEYIILAIDIERSIEKGNNVIGRYCFHEIMRSMEKGKNMIGDIFLIRLQDQWKKKTIAIDDIYFRRIAILIENESNYIEKDFRMKERTNYYLLHLTQWVKKFCVGAHRPSLQCHV